MNGRVGLWLLPANWKPPPTQREARKIAEALGPRGNSDFRWYRRLMAKQARRGAAVIVPQARFPHTLDRATMRAVARKHARKRVGRWA